MVKIKSFVLALGAIFFLSNCGSAGKENSSETKSDSLLINNKQLEKSVGLFKEASLPFVVDTAFLFKMDKGDSLGEFEIRTLAEKHFKHDLTNRFPYDLATFLKIDSIKSVEKYREYCDSLDIGMTKVSTAHALNEFHLDANTLILVWGIYAGSYEACPYSNSWLTYFTIIYKGNVGETFLLGEYTSWADAPASVERTVSSKFLADGTLTVDVLQINDQDMDSATVEVNKEQHSFMIKDGVIKLLSDKIEPALNEKRKSNN
jgi:hypothetical protein